MANCCAQLWGSTNYPPLAIEFIRISAPALSALSTSAYTANDACSDSHELSLADSVLHACSGGREEQRGHGGPRGVLQVRPMLKSPLCTVNDMLSTTGPAVRLVEHGELPYKGASSHSTNPAAC